ncbi:hypothetical protein Acsp03_56520 [Actinomadura sp. NBRC 104412]|uniref:hypothetical protein n=1 Tax=Actinomadura sp. NBRC 104412 TaxID=3032203 RepID=UPI0024A37FDD|nr:hypothetical protein [Actinomadura sp. NBRC 104412]GLZ08186.1 hypothetical protein Acsp03_56520 [Actinomadura sp. NBRC 104412]
MTRDRDQQPRRAASADDAFLEVTGARAKATAPRTKTPPRGTSKATPGGAGLPDATTPRPATADAQATSGAGAETAGCPEVPAGTPYGLAVPNDRDDRHDQDTGTRLDAVTPEEVRDRLRRRAIFLRELAEARELRQRVTPHRSRRARIHAALRRRTFRLH